VVVGQSHLSLIDERYAGLRRQALEQPSHPAVRSHRPEGRDEDDGQDSGDDRVLCPAAPAGFHGQAAGEDEPPDRNGGDGHDREGKMDPLVQSRAREHSSWWIARYGVLGENPVDDQAHTLDATENWIRHRTHPPTECLPPPESRTEHEHAEGDEVGLLDPAART